MVSDFIILDEITNAIVNTECIFQITGSDISHVPELEFQEENMVLGRKFESDGTAGGQNLFFNPVKGEIRTPDGERVAIINVESLSAVCDAIYKKMGDEISDVLYTAGLEWGTREFYKFQKQSERESKRLYHLKNMSLSEFKKRFNNLLSNFGWGTFDIEQKYDFVFIKLNNSSYAEMLSAQNPVYNDLFAGFFAGFFSELIGVDFDCVELQLNKDNFEAVYLLADESVTSEARRRLAEGSSFNEIVRILERGDFKKTKRKSSVVKDS